MSTDTLEEIVQIAIALPIADRARSFAFYRDGLGLDALGELAEDGIPEPLQFELNDATRIMLVPAGGFGWVIGEGRTVASPGQSECVLSLYAEAPEGVDELVGRAAAAGAGVVAAPERRPWGYTATFTDLDGHLWQVVAP